MLTPERKVDRTCADWAPDLLSSLIVNLNQLDLMSAGLRGKKVRCRWAIDRKGEVVKRRC